MKASEFLSNVLLWTRPRKDLPPTKSLVLPNMVVLQPISNMNQKFCFFCFSIQSFSVCQELPNISQAQLVYQVAFSHTQPKGVITLFLPHISSLTPSPHGEEEGTL